MRTKYKGPSIWYLEAHRLWWKSRRAKSRVYREHFEMHSWRYLFIDAGIHPVLMARPALRGRA